jgi:hypothetical protein
MSIQVYTCIRNKEHTTKDQEDKDMADMREQTFGVEIEMNHITRKHAAQVAATFFGTNHYEDTHFVDGYYTWSAWDDQGRKWKFSRDVSIVGNDDEKCELVTPILHYEDIETLQELARQLRHAGAKSDATRGCGVHIHIGADGHDAKTLRHLINIMYSHEELIIPALNIGTYRLNTYCKPVDHELVKRVNEKKPKNMKEMEDCWYEANHTPYGRDQHYNNSRYHMLNLHATFTKGTIEFRCFQFDTPDGAHRSGIHAGKIKAWVQFCMAVSQMAKEAKASRPLRSQTDNQKYAMTGWLCRMGLVGDEFETLRKVFNEKLTGNAAKRYIA